MKSDKKYFILFANCIPVKGYKRSVICDLQRGKYVFIPNSLYHVAQFFRSDSIKELLIRFNLDESTLIEYLDYLMEYDLGFYTDNPNEFPEIDSSYETPYLLNDCIIEISEISLSYSDKILNELQITGCQNLELRSYKYFDERLIFELIERLKVTRVRNVEVYNAYDALMKLDEMSSCMHEQQIISRYYIHSAPFDKIDKDNDKLIFTSEKINSNNCCGNISSNYFTTNLPSFFEAKSYNSCLYRKLAIDETGNIKNCPSLPATFGHINSTSFTELIDNSTFRKFWDISKDQINTCKDCEFRYICSDCRAFLSNSTGKPAKCNYNPYTNSYEKN